MDKTEPASETKETHECEFYLDNESVVYGCECGDIEIGGKTYYPEDKVNLLKEEITRLKAELEALKILKDATKKGSEIYANLKFDDEPFTPYQLALQEVDKLKAELERERELRKELWQSLKNANDLLKKTYIEQKKTSLGWGGPMQDGPDTPHEIQRKLANSMDIETMTRNEEWSKAKRVIKDDNGLPIGFEDIVKGPDELEGSHK